jgi:hypothetical protein
LPAARFKYTVRGPSHAGSGGEPSSDDDGEWVSPSPSHPLVIVRAIRLPTQFRVRVKPELQVSGPGPDSEVAAAE